MGALEPETIGLGEMGSYESLVANTIAVSYHCQSLSKWLFSQ